MNIFFQSARLLAAALLGQSLFYKFSAAPESVYIFTRVGIEPWGRIGTGVLELIAVILLFVPGFSWLGALLALGVISGAIFFHLTLLGIVVQGDGGQLFIYALLIFFAALFVLFVKREEGLQFIRKFLPA